MVVSKCKPWPLVWEAGALSIALCPSGREIEEDESKRIFSFMFILLRQSLIHSLWYESFRKKKKKHFFSMNGDVKDEYDEDLWSMLQKHVTRKEQMAPLCAIDQHNAPAPKWSFIWNHRPAAVSAISVIRCGEIFPFGPLFQFGKKIRSLFSVRQNFGWLMATFSAMG